MTHARVVFSLIVLLLAPTGLLAATATWDRNPEPDVAGYRLSYGTQPGVYTTSIDVGNVVTYQFQPPAGYRYYVVVQAYNGAGGISPYSTEVTVDIQGTVNRAPTLTRPADQASLQGASASLALVASDPDGTALTYSASGLPPGLAVSATTGLISGMVSTAGAYSVIATVSDGQLSASQTFAWTVTAASGTPVTVNLSPQDTTIMTESGNRSAHERLTMFTWPANRVGMATVMKFDLSPIPANATVQSATLSLVLVRSDNFTADPTYAVSLHRVINKNPDIALATGRTFDGVTAWTANACCADSIPMAQADIAPATAVTAVGRTAGVTYTWDATSIVQSWKSAPTANYGLLLNADTSKLDSRYRGFASMDNATVSQRPFLRITYTVPSSSTTDTTAPTVSISAPANNTAVSGPSVTVSATAADAVGVAGVRFRLDGANLGNEDTTAPFAITWDTTAVAGGAHVLTAVARDAAGNTTTSAPVAVTVNNTVANRAPTLTQPANQTSGEGTAVSLALVATDPDGNALTYSATGLPAGLSVNASSGLISGTPTFTSAGVFSVVATASDGLLAHSRTFTWTITNTNRAPLLAQPANQTSMVNTTVSLALSASDPDGTAVTWGVAGLPPALSVTAATGVISGTLSASSAGVYTVTVTASDGLLTASTTFVWSVDNADVGVVGDFDGDGRTDPATYRASTGEWRTWPSRSNFVAATPVVWGGGTDVPVPADYDGDGSTDFAVYRSGTWHVLLSSTNRQSSLDIQWGGAADRPVPLDHDGDGRADLALLRFGGFEILLSSTNYATSVIVR